MNKENETTSNKPMAHDTLLGTVIYLVTICSGEYGDYSEYHIFATTDKDTAEKWRDKYNRIIDSNKDRINHYYDDGNYDKPKPFWYDEIKWDFPTSRVTEIELR